MNLFYIVCQATQLPTSGCSRCGDRQLLQLQHFPTKASTDTNASTWTYLSTPFTEAEASRSSQLLQLIRFVN